MVKGDLDVPSFLTPLLLMMFLNWALFGVLTVQLYIYHLAFQTDRVYESVLVGIVYCLEILQVALSTHDACYLFALEWGDTSHLGDIQTRWFSVPILTGAIGCIAQCFYAYRIYQLGKTVWIAGLVVVTVALASGSSIWAGLDARAINRLTFCMSYAFLVGSSLSDSAFKDTSTPVFKAAMVWLSTTALCDLLIASCMSYYLHEARKSSPVRRTKAVLARLIVYTVET
ncbi:hypothetical protein EIP91_011191, partial [Steccherinum ochraceum]